ncbi:MAG: group II intron maturase-specific domain-containing protein [Methylocella sp.]
MVSRGQSTRKSIQKIKDKVGSMLRRGDNRPLDEIVLDLNQVLRGWSNYFSMGTRVPANRAVDNHVYDRMRNFLARRHKVGTRGSRRFSRDVVFGEIGVLQMARVYYGSRPTALQ